MKKFITLLILLAVVLFTAGCTEEVAKNSTNLQNISEKNHVVEATQLEQINKSLQKGPVLLKIGADWCGPCQEMKPILSELAKEYDGKATIMSVDADNSFEFANYFVVNSIPDSSVIVGIENGEYVYIQEDGNISDNRLRARILGIRSKEEFKKILDLAIQKIKST
jgi:thiol-disulfide isomerase/thioredoxin